MPAGYKSDTNEKGIEENETLNRIVLHQFDRAVPSESDDETKNKYNSSNAQSDHDSFASVTVPVPKDCG